MVYDDIRTKSIETVSERRLKYTYRPNKRIGGKGNNQ
jgi:hypothetical protein